MIQIYAYIGVNGSGKDYQANLKKQGLGEGTIVLDFSDGVRDFTFSFLGWKPKNVQEYEEFKTGKSTMFLGNLVHRTGREFLDNIGKRMRDYDNHFWADYTKNKAVEAYSEGCKNFVFNSVRYDEEIEAIKLFATRCALNEEIYIKFIFCDYRSEKYDDTPREYQELALHFRDMGIEDLQDITKFVYGKID